VNVGSFIDPTADTALVNNLSVTTTSEVDYYTFNAPSNTTGTFSVTVQSSGLSLLSPDLTVYAADQKTVLGSAIGLGQYGATLTASISGAFPGEQFYAVVQGADTSAFSTGRYALALNFGANPTPTAPSPIIAIPDGNPITSGGGVADGAGVKDDLLSSVPEITGISPDNGLSTNDGVTDVPNLSITGQAPAGTRVSLYRNGQLIGTTVTGQAPAPSLAPRVPQPSTPPTSTSTASTTWWFNATGTTLADGTYSFAATATDAMGNVSALSFPFQVIINTQIPSAPIITGAGAAAGSASPSAGSNPAAPTLFGTAAPNSEVTVYLQRRVVGTTFATSSGAWRYTSAPLGAGIYAFSTTDTSLAGDVSAVSQVFTLKIGSRAPETSAPLLLTSILTSLFGASSGISTFSPIFVGLATPGTVVTIFDGDTGLGTATVGAPGFWVFVSPNLSVGQQTVYAEGTCFSGLTGLPSATVTFTL
jgi:Bacterial Ig-like domain